MSEISQEQLDQIEVTITATVAQVNQLLIILGETAFVKAAPLVNLVQSQAAPQVQAAIAAQQAADPSVVTDVQPTSAT